MAFQSRGGLPPPLTPPLTSLPTSNAKKNGRVEADRDRAGEEDRTRATSSAESSESNAGYANRNKLRCEKENFDLRVF